MPSTVQKIAFLGNYPPRKCGIATFTADLLTSVASAHRATECICVSVNDRGLRYEYPEEVYFEIEEQDLSSYLRAADFLNLRNVDIVCLQHEFGIFGGLAGGHVLALLRELNMPVVSTLHTVLREPREAQRRVLEEIVSLSARVVVMTEQGRQMLLQVYGAPAEKIEVIAHGIPDVPFVDSASFKAQFGLEGKTVLLTFGLLSPNKGIEQVLKSLPSVLTEFPQVVYVVLGATHPHELREHGEAYRVSLELLAQKQHITNSVVFYNEFVDLASLKEFIGACDIYITPYGNEAQVTSGTLANAFGAGKPVISTPYWHAKELLADGRGVLVPFADSQAIGDAIKNLLRDHTCRNAMRVEAYRLGREMIWSQSAERYMKTFESARADEAATARKSHKRITLDRRPRELPSLKLDHLARMTDSTGLFQHSIFNIPNFAEGYCTDDNARALILALILMEGGEAEAFVKQLASTCAAFLYFAFNHKSQRFHNHLSFDRRWLDEQGSEDSQGRALWALGTCVGRSADRSLQRMAGQLFALSLPPVADFSSPRAWAFALLGIDEYLHRFSGDSYVSQLRDSLLRHLLRLLNWNTKQDWRWFEEELSYDNAKLAHALIVSSYATGNAESLEQGLMALRWLNQLHISEHGHFRPIGSNGFHGKGRIRADFDQQPIEAHAMVSACLAAYRVTADLWWYEQAQRAFDWFLGANDLNLELYLPESGGCCDGLHVDRINENQGAESTLAFLLSLVEMRQSQNVWTSFPKPLRNGGA